MKDLIELKQSDGLYSLTDIWKASGRGNEFSPSRWAAKPRNKKSGVSGKISKSGGPGWQFIEYIAKTLNSDADHLFRKQRGRNGGTFAHWQLALAYAKYLSPELHAQVNQVFKERLEEKQNPMLGIDRAVDRAEKSYLKQNKPNKWISKRIMSKAIRLSYTDTLQDHGCDGVGIGMNTNTQYKELFGGKANELKEKRGLQKTENLRDSMSMLEIAQLSLAEELAADRIEKDNAQGNWSCNKRSKAAAKSVKGAIESFNEPARIAAEEARRNFFDKFGGDAA